MEISKKNISMPNNFSYLKSKGICPYSECKYGDKCKNKHVSPHEKHAVLIYKTGICCHEALHGEVCPSCKAGECIFASSMAEAMYNYSLRGWDPVNILKNAQRYIDTEIKLQNKDVPIKRKRVCAT
jgi:hypothetical protein